MTKSDKANGKRQRTFTGCRTCRRRRVKCDEQRPVCGHCRRLKLDCEGYDALIQWMRPIDVANFWDAAEDELAGQPVDARQSRRQLFSDTQREFMCTLLSNSTRDLDYNKATLRFEEDCQADGETLTLGPFGAFSLNWSLQGGSDSVEDLDQTLATLSGSGLTTSLDAGDNAQSVNIDQEVLALLEAHGDDPIHALGLTDGLHSNFTPNHEANNPLSTLDNWLPNSTLGMENMTYLTHNEPQYLSFDATMEDTNPTDMHIPFSSSLIESRPASGITHDMEVLLSHFVAKYVRPGSIWQLQSTEIQKALGQIAMHMTPNAESLAILNATMAVSAYNLDRLNTLDEGSGYWWTIGSEYKVKAIDHLQAVLGNRTACLDKARYKTILMALLTMVNVCLTSGKLEEARIYLLDAQKMIKTSAKQERQQSRKVQLLHAVFVYLRVMEEASFVYPISIERSLNNNRSHIYSVTKYPSLAIKDLSNGSDFSSIIVPDWAFEAPGNAVRAIFANSLGLPESLLVLMSHITFISCEARQARACDIPASPEVRQDFENRVKVIEELLCAWSYDNDRHAWETLDSPTTTPGSENGMRGFLEHIAIAFHTALLLNFYREIKDINRLILQTLVNKITTHLLACENSKQQNDIPSSSVVWPGFIAAIEAIDENDFAQIIGWMRSCADRYGARSFDRAITAATEIRSSRMQSGTESWPDIMLQKGIFLVLS